MAFTPDYTAGGPLQVPASERSTIVWPTGSATFADFGPYELIEEVGRGGMGVVFKARQKRLDRIVAIKMILGSHLANQDQVARFYAEARAAARLQDPRIVAIHDVGQYGGQHYFAMEFIAGPSLARLLEAGPLDPMLAARLVLEVARAMGRLHALGIVHRDLKPSNILLDEQGQPSISDFGLAKMLSADGPTTRTGAIIGTPSYMAPEQAAGRGEAVGPLSDVYSLGAILYELLAGRPPFDEPSPLDTLVQVLERDPDPPSRIRPEIPKDLEKICLACLEKAPEGRYPSADALADDLGRFVRDEPVEVRRVGIWRSLGRWARREPALASRLSTLMICGSVLQIDQAAYRTIPAMLYRQILVMLGLGLAASLVFQTLLNKERWSSLARYTWATADVILLSTVILFSEAQNGPLVAAFFLLVAASGLWFRERLVWYTAGLSVFGNVALGVAEYADQASIDALRRVSLVLIGLIATGSVVAYQVRRVRALSRFYEHRPLP